MTRRTISQRAAAAGIVTIVAIGAAGTWTLTRLDNQPVTATPANPTPSSAEPVNNAAPTEDTSTPPPPGIAPAIVQPIDPTVPTTPSASTPHPTDSPSPRVVVDPSPASAADPAAPPPSEPATEFTAAQRRAAVEAARETVAALEVVQDDGTRPDIPHVDPTSWLATTPFDAPPAQGLRRSVTGITTDIVADGHRTLYIHATWRIVDHKTGTKATAADATGPQRDFVLEAVHQQPGWLITDFHPELPLNAAHRPVPGTNPNG